MASGMKTDKKTLADAYAAMSDDELLGLHSSGTLTFPDYYALETEIAGRGLIIPKRPKIHWPRSLKAHWKGEASLASAFWGIGLARDIQGPFFLPGAFHMRLESWILSERF
jgi:hypothetical protein